MTFPEDSISRSKRILALVDACIERHTRDNRTALRTTLFQELEQARLQGRQEAQIPVNLTEYRQAEADALEKAADGIWEGIKLCGDPGYFTTAEIWERA